VAACAVFLIGKLVLHFFNETSDPYTLACKYKEGRDVAQNYAKAAALFRKAAEAGNADAEFNLALLYQNGQGVEQDSNEAFSWARKSADQNNAAGETLLGTMYESGEGVSHDEAAAADLYNKAAYQGYAWAESLLANMYMSGRGNLEQDYVLAYKWFSRAAAGGDETARSALKLLPGLMTNEQLRQAQELAQGD
jgi:TPR repeat protein